MLGVNRPSLDDEGNVINAPSPAFALVVPVYSNSSLLNSPNLLLLKYVVEQTSSVKRSYLLGNIHARYQKRQSLLDQFIWGPTKVAKDVKVITKEDSVNLVQPV